MMKVRAVATMLAGGILGYIVGPWLAVSRGLAPWYAPVLWYLAVGPVRWMAWLVAASWTESAWNPGIRGDAGESVGILQYNRYATVQPADRTSAYQSGFTATEYMLAAMAAAPLCSAVTLRLPVAGYLGFRWSWRTGSRPCGWRGLPSLAYWPRERRAALTLAITLAILAFGFMTAMLRARR